MNISTVVTKLSDILRLVVVLLLFPVMFASVPIALLIDWLENTSEEITALSTVWSYFAWVKELGARVWGTV